MPTTWAQKLRHSPLLFPHRHSVLRQESSLQKTLIPPDGSVGDPIPKNTRFANSEVAGLAAADVPKLKLLWAFSLGDGTMVHSQAAVAGEHVYASSLTGQVFSLDSRTGCIHWTFSGSNPVRSAIVLGPTGRAPKRNAVYFGDQAANVYSVDASTGKLLWQVHVSDHFAAMITGAPVLHAGVLYVPVSSFEEWMATSPAYECCTFRGSVLALDAATGKTIWKTDTIADPPLPTEKNKSGTQLHGPSGAAVWSAPTCQRSMRFS